MKRIDKLPPAFKRFDRMNGVLRFALFEEVISADDQALAAIGEAFPRENWNLECLDALGFRRIRQKGFFGDWYDLDRGKLIVRGSYLLADGSQVQDPVLSSLRRKGILSGGTPIPDAGSGGDFAYAFSHPPYGLRARPEEIQSVFEEIRDTILPPGEVAEICDWSNPRLPEVSRYFALGMEWWGVFLFTIHIPALRRLTVIAGSTTD